MAQNSISYGSVFDLWLIAVRSTDQAKISLNNDIKVESCIGIVEWHVKNKNREGIGETYKNTVPVNIDVFSKGLLLNWMFQTDKGLPLKY